MFVRTPVRRLTLADPTLHIFIKDETKQPSGSFKLRGVSRKLRGRQHVGVVTASTGNHGIAVAMVCRKNGWLPYVFVPSTTPFVKQEALRVNGAIVMQIAGDYDQAFLAASTFSIDNDLPFIPSFDDPDIIAGHQSLYKELDEQVSLFDQIFVPVGGGGLLAAGVEHYAGTKTLLVGVEAEWAPKLDLSLKQRSRVVLDTVSGPAEGIQTRAIGAMPLERILVSHVNVELVSEDLILAAIRTLWVTCGIRAEGAGASALAAALKTRPKADYVVCIVSGGNIDDELFQRALGTGDDSLFFTQVLASTEHSA